MKKTKEDDAMARLKNVIGKQYRLPSSSTSQNAFSSSSFSSLEKSQTLGRSPKSSSSLHDTLSKTLNRTKNNNNNNNDNDKDRPSSLHHQNEKGETKKPPKTSSKHTSITPLAKNKTDSSTTSEKPQEAFKKNVLKKATQSIDLLEMLDQADQPKPQQPSIQNKRNDGFFKGNSISNEDVARLFGLEDDVFPSVIPSEIEKAPQVSHSSSKRQELPIPNRFSTPLPTHPKDHDDDDDDDDDKEIEKLAKETFDEINASSDEDEEKEKEKTRKDERMVVVTPKTLVIDLEENEMSVLPSSSSSPPSNEAIEAPDLIQYEKKCFQEGPLLNEAVPTNRSKQEPLNASSPSIQDIVESKESSHPKQEEPASLPEQNEMAANPSHSCLSNPTFSPPQEADQTFTLFESNQEQQQQQQQQQQQKEKSSNEESKQIENVDDDDLVPLSANNQVVVVGKTHQIEDHASHDVDDMDESIQETSERKWRVQQLMDVPHIKETFDRIKGLLEKEWQGFHADILLLSSNLIQQQQNGGKTPWQNHQDAFMTKESFMATVFESVGLFIKTIIKPAILGIENKRIQEKLQDSVLRAIRLLEKKLGDQDESLKSINQWFEKAQTKIQKRFSKDFEKEVIDKLSKTLERSGSGISSMASAAEGLRLRSFTRTRIQNSPYKKGRPIECHPVAQLWNALKEASHAQLSMPDHNNTQQQQRHNALNENSSRVFLTDETTALAMPKHPVCMVSGAILTENATTTHDLLQPSSKQNNNGFCIARLIFKGSRSRSKQQSPTGLFKPMQQHLSFQETICPRRADAFYCEGFVEWKQRKLFDALAVLANPCAHVESLFNNASSCKAVLNDLGASSLEKLCQSVCSFFEHIHQDADDCEKRPISESAATQRLTLQLVLSFIESVSQRLSFFRVTHRAFGASFLYAKTVLDQLHVIIGNNDDDDDDLTTKPYPYVHDTIPGAVSEHLTMHEMVDRLVFEEVSYRTKRLQVLEKRRKHDDNDGGYEEEEQEEGRISSFSLGSPMRLKPALVSSSSSSSQGLFTNKKRPLDHEGHGMDRVLKRGRVVQAQAVRSSFGNNSKRNHSMALLDSLMDQPRAAPPAPLRSDPSLSGWLSTRRK